VLLPQILPLLDTSKSRFIDLFAGGGAVYTAAVPLFPSVLVNDVVRWLPEIQQMLLTDPAGTTERVKALAPPKDSQDAYRALRAAFNASPSPEAFYALILSCTNNMSRFNQTGGFNQTWGKRSFSSATQRKIDEWVAYLAPFADRIQFSALSFENIEVGAGDMLYLDPPYANSEAGYNSIWSAEHETKLLAYTLDAVQRGASVLVSGVETHGERRSVLIDGLIAAGLPFMRLDKNYQKVARIKDKVTVEVVVGNVPALNE